MLAVYYSSIHLLELIASHCQLPYHSYLREVDSDGSVLGEVEPEILFAVHPFTLGAFFSLTGAVVQQFQLAYICLPKSAIVICTGTK
jgi:hypothetical protein